MRALAAPVERSSDVISFLSPTGCILCSSSSGGKSFGYLAEELVGRDTFDLIHPDDRSHSRSALAAVLAAPLVPRRLELRMRRKDGSWCWVESTISNLLGEPRFGAIVVNFRSIGEHGSAMLEVRRQTAELIRSNERLEDFAYAVAHDLREPLRTISMFTEMLLKGAVLDAEGQENAQFIVDGVKRASALFDGLYAFALQPFDDPSKPVDLGGIAADVLLNLRQAIETSGAEVIIEPLPVVLGNEQHLLRVLQNIIVNAIKYRSEAPLKVRVTAEALVNKWIIKVWDNGVGIAPEHHESVFGLFKRLHGPETPGAGVGLAICKKIVGDMGGAIWVESALGRGSTFCFTVQAVAAVGRADMSLKAASGCSR